MTTADDLRTVERRDDPRPDVPDVAITAHRSSPGRTVFTEEGNTDAWIAIDTTVSPVQ